MKLNAAQTMFLLNHAFSTEKGMEITYKGNRRSVAGALERKGLLIITDLEYNQFYVELTPVGEVVSADLVKQFDHAHPPARRVEA